MMEQKDLRIYEFGWLPTKIVYGGTTRVTLKRSKIMVRPHQNLAIFTVVRVGGYSEEVREP